MKEPCEWMLKIVMTNKFREKFVTFAYFGVIRLCESDKYCKYSNN